MTKRTADDIEKSWPESDKWATPAPVIASGIRWLKGDVDKAWDPFYYDGRSKVYLEDFGIATISEPGPVEDHERVPAGVSHIITNPPFSCLESVLPKVFSFGVPMLLLLPRAVLSKLWFQDLVDPYDMAVRPISRSLCRFIKDGKAAEDPIMNCVWVYIDCDIFQTPKKPKQIQ